ncbi:MAG TPA: TMEM165/GDT1 family protein [Acidothermaceae bacterium]|nr:TMEM165/GDT1 family protein [Acidothermaceae bacterium]
MSLAVAAIAFGVVFLAELPDKSMIASLVLGTRFRPLYVWVGAAAAFAVHVVIAVAAGGVLALLPHRLVEGIVAVLFLAGAATLLFGSESNEEEAGLDEGGNVVDIPVPTLRRVASVSFVVIFVGEWGDITQIATANLAAKYHDPIGVGIGALLGLWTVVAIGVVAGSKLVERVPLVLVRRITGLILAALGVVSTIAAIRG